MALLFGRVSARRLIQRAKDESARLVTDAKEEAEHRDGRSEAHAGDEASGSDSGRKHEADINALELQKRVESARRRVPPKSAVEADRTVQSRYARNSKTSSRLLQDIEEKRIAKITSRSKFDLRKQRESEAASKLSSSVNCKSLSGLDPEELEGSSWRSRVRKSNSESTPVKKRPLFEDEIRHSALKRSQKRLLSTLRWQPFPARGLHGARHRCRRDSEWTT